MSRDLSLDELKHTLNKLITALEDEYKVFLRGTQKELLVDHIAHALTQGNKKSYTKEDLLQPEFIKKLSFSIVAAMTAENNQQFSEIISNTFKEKGINLKEVAKLTPEKFAKLLKDNFTPAELKKLRDKLLENSKAVSNELNSKLNNKPSPKSQKLFENEIADAAFINMFGLLTKEPGTMLVPVFSFNGNYMNITDYNPNNGYAQIDLVNNLEDTAYGDPQGLNQMAKENFGAISGSLVDAIASTIEDTLEPHHSPFDTRRGPKPPGTLPGQ